MRVDRYVCRRDSTVLVPTRYGAAEAQLNGGLFDECLRARGWRDVTIEAEKRATGQSTDDEHWSAQVKNLASKHLGCAPNSLGAVWNQDGTASVTGCGARAEYAWTPEGWKLIGDSLDAGATTL